MPGIALVLGAGGTVGHAFHAGVLAALADVRGWDARQADVVVGTSAGSAVAALLRAGMPPTDLLKRGSRLPLSAEGRPSSAGPASVRRARARPASGRRGRWRRPARLRPCRPRARGRSRRARWPPPCCRPARSAPATWLCRSTTSTATPGRAGRRGSWPCSSTAAGASRSARPGAPAARVSDAVRASCAIPAFFEPAEIDGERYVDGGVHSTTNADLVAGERPDLVLVERADVGGRAAPCASTRRARCADRRALAGPRGRRPARPRASRSSRSSRRRATSR